MNGDTRVYYLLHSGFAVETGNHFLIFDYYAGSEPFAGPLEAGKIESAALRDKNVIVFASHFHQDHYDKRILEWRKDIPGIRYVLSDDIAYARTASDSAVIPVHFGNHYDLGDVEITTLHSTDEGVAFLVRIDGITIYHAGDLNWWHWSGETESYNKSMAGQYRHEIDQLAGIPIDLAFVPVDPRLEGNYSLGLQYVCQQTSAQMIFPMHFWEQYEVFDWIAKDSLLQDYQERIGIITKRGQMFQYIINESSKY